MAGFVYVCGTHDRTASPLLKVGRAKDLPKRASSMQTGSPVRLTYLAAWRLRTYEEAARLELAIHHLLWRERRHGEWFECSLDAIEAAVKHVAPRCVNGSDHSELNRLTDGELSRAQRVANWHKTEDAIAERREQKRLALIEAAEKRTAKANGRKGTRYKNLKVSIEMLTRMKAAVSGHIDSGA